MGNINFFNKIATLKKDVVLKEHQSRAIEKMLASDDKSLLAAHATGSGKTLTGIAAFEKLKSEGHATKAIVVVPSSLKSNFVDAGVKKFTNSSVSVFGAKNEKSDKKIGDKSNSTYNVVSYDLFREHGEKIIEDTGADTLILDEVHKVRSTEGTTYNRLRDLREKFKQAITLTGSVVNNEPNEIVPLMDITFKPSGHKLISKDFFDRTFVDKKTVTQGFLNPKVYVEKNIKNKQQLAKYLGKQIDYVGHDELEKFMPKKNTEVVEVPMSKEQSNIYHYTMTSVDPITRWKISNNIPVGQKEAADAFSKLTQARQVSTDPSILSEDLKKKSILDISPKVKRIVEDAHAHLNEKDNHKVIIYGNLIQGQLESIERGLKEKGMEYTKFFGVGNEGSSAAKRVNNIKDYMNGSKRILLVSGAGAEGLDLKGTTMLQMAEGHYNPERIHQAESRAIRLGSPVDSVKIKRYISTPLKTKFTSALDSVAKRFGMTTGNAGIDSWVYSIAEKKTNLNNQFKDAFREKSASAEDWITKADRFTKVINGATHAVGGAMAAGGAGMLARGIFVDQSEPYNKRTRSQKILSSLPTYAALAGAVGGGIYGSRFGIDSIMKTANFESGFSNRVRQLGSSFSGLPSTFYVNKIMKPATDKETERVIKQKLVDSGKESLIGKKHFQNILNESGISQRALDITYGLSNIASAAALANISNVSETPLLRNVNKVFDFIGSPLIAGAKLLPVNGLKEMLEHPAGKNLSRAITGGIVAGAVTPILLERIRRGVIGYGINHNSQGQLDKGIARYEEKLRKKMHSKYKTSKSFVREYDTKQDLGIDILS